MNYFCGKRDSVGAAGLLDQKTSGTSLSLCLDHISTKVPVVGEESNSFFLWSCTLKQQFITRYIGYYRLPSRYQFIVF